jgi:hypothetical protein
LLTPHGLLVARRGDLGHQLGHAGGRGDHILEGLDHILAHRLGQVGVDLGARLLHPLGRRLGLLLLRTLFLPLGAVQHISTRHIMLARAHQREFDLILNVLDMEGTASRLTTHHRAHHALRKLLNQFAHTR